MSTTKRNTYRGKYPNRIVSAWSTTTKGVNCCETNKGERFFFTTREMIAAGYKVGACQILKMEFTALEFLTTSIADAAMRVEQPKKVDYDVRTKAQFGAGIYICTITVPETSTMAQIHACAIAAVTEVMGYEPIADDVTFVKAYVR